MKDYSVIKHALERGKPEPDADEIETVGAVRYSGWNSGYLVSVCEPRTRPAFHLLIKQKSIKDPWVDMDRWKAARQFGSTSEYP